MVVTVLRWILGTVAGLFTVSWAGFFVFADRFRRSWGASPNAKWTLVVPLVVASLLLLSALLPSNRLLLHTTALVILAVTVAALAIVRAAPLLVSSWLIYAALWLFYYLQTLRSGSD